MKKIILYIFLIASVPANYALANCCPAGASGDNLDVCVVSDNEGNLVCEDRYYKNGNLKAEIHYKEKQIDGVAKSYYENGKLEKEVTYTNGKKNGIARTYYENGQLKNELSFVNDQPEGVQKSYWENGNLRVECSSKDGKHSLCKAYEKDGKLKSECSFKDGKPDSNCKFKWTLKKLFN